MTSAPHLRIVRATTREPGASSGCAPELGDLVLIAMLFVLNLIPIAGALAGIGHWSPAIVGFATGAVLLTGRELLSQLRARVRQRGEP
jgi:uncharacterized membrane protein (DUF4010 family)